MATESEQVRILRENELLKAENERLTTMVAVRDDLIAETAVELEQAQAEKERLLNLLVDRESLVAEYIMTEEQAQARVTALEEVIQWAADQLVAPGPAGVLLRLHRTLVGALAAPAREEDADA